MEDLIYCNFNLFTLNQSFYIIRDQVPALIKDSTSETLAEDLSIAANQYSINKIVLQGPKEYGNMLAENILTFSETKYNNQSLYIEVRV